MTLNPTLSIPSSQKSQPDIYHQIVTREFPNEPDGEKINYVVRIKQLVILANSPNQQAAKDFMFFFIQPENLGNYLKETSGRYFPVMPVLWSDSFWSESEDKHIAVAAKQLTQENNQLFYSVLNPAYSQVQTQNIWGQAIEHIITEKWSAEEAIDEAINQIKQIFAQEQN